MRSISAADERNPAEVEAGEDQRPVHPPYQRPEGRDEKNREDGVSEQDRPGEYPHLGKVRGGEKYGEYYQHSPHD